MLLRTRMKRPRVAIPVGLGCLALGGLLREFVRPGPVLTLDLVQGITGLAYGLGIGILLMGLWMVRREESANA